MSNFENVEFFEIKKKAIKRLSELNNDKYALLGLGGTPEDAKVYAVIDERWFEENMSKEGFVKKKGEIGWVWEREE